MATPQDPEAALTEMLRNMGVSPGEISQIVAGGPDFLRGGMGPSAQSMRDRREELGMSVAQAAMRAGVTEATWRNYERGTSTPRADKRYGVNAALQWDVHGVPSGLGDSYQDFGGLSGDPFDRVVSRLPSWTNAREEAEGTYSVLLEATLGENAARTFAVGAEAFRGMLLADLNELSALPRGSHVGELDLSLIRPTFPVIWLTRYDYEFVAHMLCDLEDFLAKLVIYPMLEPLPLTTCVAQVVLLNNIFASGSFAAYTEDMDVVDASREWHAELSDGGELLDEIFAPNYFPEPDSPSHFDHWFAEVPGSFIPRWKFPKGSGKRGFPGAGGENIAKVTELRPRR